MGPDKKFKVIIAGGSIAGLTLAHCLDQAGIDYVVLEKHDNVAPELGASIGIMPNGARILDQLGLFNEIEGYVDPLHLARVCYPDGFNFGSNYPSILNSRFGYPISFLRRSQLLKTLYTNLRDKSKVHLHRKLSSVETLDDGIRVQTSDGSTFDGDLLVGADGVHSYVRSSMWRNANQLQPNRASNQEKSSNKDMFVEYSCVFGISAPVPGLEIGEQMTCLCDSFTILTIHGKGGVVFWFLIQKLNKKYLYPDVPRFTHADAIASGEKVRGTTVWKKITFGDLWDNRDVVSMTALDEYVIQTWTYGRLFCIGDSVHKMTPNLGQAANIAIEDAAALTNTLQRLLRNISSETPTTLELETALKELNKQQYPRAASVFKAAKFSSRVQARDGLFNTLIGRYFVPNAGDFPAEISARSMGAAGLLDCVDPPTREGPYWKNARHGKKSGQGHRLALILPGLIIGIIVAYLAL